MLPTLLTLSNFFLGLLAVSWGIDALSLAGGGDAAEFYSKIEAACMLVFFGMVADALDGKVARLTNSMSDFGAQLDSFADAFTFGVAPAFLVKILIEGEAQLTGSGIPPRLAFVAAAFFATMAILRLARFNLETDTDAESHMEFRGLPSPGAAGMIVSSIWLYVILRRPDLEMIAGTKTPLGVALAWTEGVDMGKLLFWVPSYLMLLLPLLGLLMVSRVRYVHVASRLMHGRSQFVTLVKVASFAIVFYLAPVPVIFTIFTGFVLYGLIQAGLERFRSSPSDANSNSGVS